MNVSVRMYRAVVTILIKKCIYDINDDVTRSQSRSNFKIAIYPSIFQLQCRLKAQNIGNAHGYLAGILNFRYHFRLKSLLRPKNGGHFEDFEILNTYSIWPQIWKDRTKNYARKSVFHGDDVIDDVTGWPPNCHLYSCLGDVGSGNRLQGQYLIKKANVVIVFLGYTCLTKISINTIFSRSKVSYRHTVDIAGDDIMYHILVTIGFVIRITKSIFYILSFCSTL